MDLSEQVDDLMMDNEDLFVQCVNIAYVCHQANKAYCDSFDVGHHEEWDKAEQWQRDTIIIGVKFALENPDAPDSALHDAWMADKVAEGWVYAETKDSELKTHPCIVPYEELPAGERKKDALFRAVVKALT